MNRVSVPLAMAAPGAVVGNVNSRSGESSQQALPEAVYLVNYEISIREMSWIWIGDHGSMMHGPEDYLYMDLNCCKRKPSLPCVICDHHVITSHSTGADSFITVLMLDAGSIQERSYIYAQCCRVCPCCQQCWS